MCSLLISGCDLLILLIVLLYMRPPTLVLMKMIISNRFSIFSFQGNTQIFIKHSSWLHMNSNELSVMWFLLACG